ncbi:DegT/DnrJ/EryC1/StrS family aminotransferase [Microvirga subterranea]|uniref:dTDP-4-amino-4,6-dideoxygalactose transaminase n=1 Tax=Microvirga subterranea TaxID=186651 RepID=A0A370HIX8_9HYPH|nr:DegT/DnrJ/EryC1/StrS family aminotransferase [Microvirga subterranea]RDI58542.1 dTDP-4-amino-4,6-dideoxygalactose transaminase [Microvirga subterranea]
MTIHIGINNLRRHAESTNAAVREAVDRVLGSGWYILGRENDALEEEFASFCGANHCVGVANGTDAIELGLRALSVERGSRVVTVANAGYYTLTALSAIGAVPVFADVDETSRLMSIDHLGEIIAQGGIDAVVITHLFGLLHDMDAILRITEPAGVPVFEDCAQAHGASRTGRRAGSFGAAASFSFYPTKNLGALGDAGAVVTQSDDTARKVRQLRQYGWKSKYEVESPHARNSRLDEIQAAILRSKLPSLNDWNTRRREIATRYSTEIHHPRVSCPPVYGEEYVAHLYVIACDDRQSLRAHLSAMGIGTDVHYPIPDYRQLPLVGSFADFALPVTEKLAHRILTLPCYPELQDEEISHIIDSINRW